MPRGRPLRGQNWGVQNVIERVLNLLIYLLESSRPVTADDVRYTVQGYDAQSDDAFHRMFERDKEVLRRLGVPIKQEALDVWEVDYGYTVDPEEYALVDLQLNQEERVALSIAAKMVRLGGSHLGLEALLKMGGVERGVGLEPVGADLGAGAEVLGSLFGALTERKEVTFAYKGSERRVRPYGIAHRRGHWYLAGGTDEGERVYRIDRIERLKVADKANSFKKPRAYDIKGAIDRHPWEAGSGDRIEAVVEFDPEVAWWAARTLGLSEPDDILQATIPVSNVDAFIGWVLSFGDQAEIVSPPEMREEVRRRVIGSMST